MDVRGYINGGLVVHSALLTHWSRLIGVCVTLTLCLPLLDVHEHQTLESSPKISRFSNLRTYREWEERMSDALKGFRDSWSVSMYMKRKAICRWRREAGVSRRCWVGREGNVILTLCMWSVIEILGSNTAAWHSIRRQRQSDMGILEACTYNSMCEGIWCVFWGVFVGFKMPVKRRY